jgi:hypothetical protein
LGKNPNLIHHEGHEGKTNAHEGNRLAGQKYQGRTARLPAKRPAVSLMRAFMVIALAFFSVPVVLRVPLLFLRIPSC